MTALPAALAKPPRPSLPRAFALDPDIHARELDVIWRASWLFAGVSAQARDPR
ncbi:MAG TPA: hypothetical protein VHV28_07075 [Solirubrobacteraceae bacterium]|nr:hypothetical protein [Solirubrobacteraceae bacterium]